MNQNQGEAQSQAKAIAELAKEKFSRGAKMSFPSRDALEQATPEAVARYRAGRIWAQISSECKETGAKAAVDLCCGIGMDAIALSRKFAKVYAFDADPETVKCAQRNAEIYGAENIEFICSPAQKADLKALGADFVFADPSRRANGRRVRLLSETEPSGEWLIEFIKKAGVQNFCIESSHTLHPQELPEGCEKEFFTLDGKPNCISLYFGELQRDNYSVVALPIGNRIAAQTAAEKADNVPSMLRYIFELNEGISRFGMQKQVLGSLGKHSERAFALNEGFLGAAQRFESAFFTNSFKALAAFEGEYAPAKERLIEKLQKLKAGKVVLRGKFEEQEQLLLKAEIESGLGGKRKLHIFFFPEAIVVCKNLAFA